LTGTGPFLVLNGDTFFEVALESLRDFHSAHKADATLSLFRSPQQGRYAGVTLGKESRVQSLNAGKKGGLANGGVYLMEPGLLEGGPWQPQEAVSLEEDILPFALGARKRVYGMECAGRFLDIGVPEDYARAAGALEARPETEDRK
jgi:D-glycero-alpha-D-manno-heptose 1-phosphate guanylyltransferase